MNLKQALTQQKEQNEQTVPQISGLLGIPLDGTRRVEVPNRNAYVYVRLRNNQSEVIQAFNNQVSASYNLPVLVERQGNRYVVVSVDTQRYENNWSSFSPFLPRHGNTHSFDLESGGGGDIVWVHSRQFMPLLALPSGSSGGPNVVIAPYTLKNEDGTWRHIGNTGTQNLTFYNPTSPTGAIMALVYVDATTGNPGVLFGTGTVFPSSLTGTSQVYPYIPASTNPNWIPDVAVRLVTGTSVITWSNMYDVRQWLHVTPTGSAGGGLSSVSVQDEGVPAGTATVFNFVGPGVVASVSGSVANVSIPGVSGTSSFSGDPSSVVLTSTSGTLFTPAWLKWGTSTNEFIEFGADEVKEVNAGKMGYNAFGSGHFDVVGAGTGASVRIVHLYDNAIVDNNFSVQGNTVLQGTSVTAMDMPSGTTYNIGGAAHAHFDDAASQPANPGTGSFDGVSTHAARADHVHRGPATSLLIYPTNALGNSLPSGTTRYLCPFVDEAPSVTERAMVVLRAGTVKNFYVRQVGNQPASGILSCLVRKNTTSDEITLNIAAGAAGPATRSETSTSFTVAAGDFIGFKFVNNAFSTSATIGFVAVEVEEIP